MYAFDPISPITPAYVRAAAACKAMNENDPIGYGACMKSVEALNVPVIQDPPEPYWTVDVFSTPYPTGKGFPWLLLLVLVATVEYGRRQK